MHDAIPTNEAPPRAFVACCVLLSVLAVVHGLTLVAQGVGPVDDDFIVYRYARNWLEAGSLAFNIGGGPGAGHLGAEGVTSPLWLAVCALGEVFSIPPRVWTPTCGLLGSGLATWFSGWASLRVLPTARWRWCLLAPALLALSPSVAWHGVAGLGTTPMMAAIAAGLWAAATQRVRTFGVCMVVAVLFRMEAVVVALPLGLAAALARAASTGPAGFRARRISAWVGPIVVCAALVTLLRWQIYGRWAPATYFIKQLPLTDELLYGGRYLLRSATEGGLVILALAAVAVPPGQGAKALRRGIAVASALALGYVLSCGGDWMVYGRFLVPFAAVFSVGAVALVASLGGRAIQGLGGLGLLLAVAAGLRQEVRSQAIFEHGFFETWWLRVGDEFKERAPEGSSLAVSPIGAIGWRSGLEIIDILGLTHTAFVGLPADLDGVNVKGHHRHDGAWVLDQEPSYLLLGNATVQPATGSIDVNPWERDIVADPRFLRDYMAETAWVSEPDGSRRPLPYFRRRGATALGPE